MAKNALFSANFLQEELKPFVRFLSRWNCPLGFSLWPPSPGNELLPPLGVLPSAYFILHDDDQEVKKLIEKVKSVSLSLIETLIISLNQRYSA